MMAGMLIDFRHLLVFSLLLIIILNTEILVWKADSRYLYIFGSEMSQKLPQSNIEHILTFFHTSASKNKWFRSNVILYYLEKYDIAISQGNGRTCLSSTKILKKQYLRLLDILFLHITTFIKVWMAFVFGFRKILEKSIN